MDPITGAAYYGLNGVVAGSRPRSPVADPSGRFVYFANQLSNTIARYEIGVSGEMSNPVTYPTGTQPYSMILAEITQN